MMHLFNIVQEIFSQSAGKSLRREIGDKSFSTALNFLCLGSIAAEEPPKFHFNAQPRRF